MYRNGKTLFLSIAYPPNPAAAAVVHRHLLDQFDPKSFVVLTGFFPGAKKAEVPKGVRSHFIYIGFEFLSSKIHRFFARIQKHTIPIFLNFYIGIIKPKRIIIGYPDLYWMDICSKVALKKKIPFIPYLHDTIIEATSYGRFEQLAREVQDRLFKHAYRIAVMSKGMKDLYQRKYNLSSVSWEHIYPEAPLPFYGEKENRAHWSGDVYEINQKSVARMNNVFAKLGMQFSVSNGKTREQLKSFGIYGDHLQKVFYPKRADYLQQLGLSKILLLGLNYPDECTISEDELSTIFSTKTPEYLGSGSLIVYHGPAHYYLARFLVENDCGVVLESRNEDELLEGLQNVLDNYKSHEYKTRNAIKCLSLFDGNLVAEKLINTLDV